MAELERLYRALQVEYGGGGDAEVRNEARSLLQRVQESPELAFHAASAILTPASGGVAPQFALMFGLSCLEKLATARWNELSDEDKVAVRSTAVAAAWRSTAAEPSYVRNKKAALVAQVALREFPQRWPTMAEELVLRESSDAEARDALLELSFSALAELAEDCTDADYNVRLPPKRRTDVLKALNAVAPALVRELFALARRAYELRESAGPTSRLGARRLVGALRCVRNFATWVCWDSEEMRGIGIDPVELCAFLAANGDLNLASDDDADVCASALAAFRSLSASAHLDYDAALRVARAAPRICEALYNKGCADFGVRGGLLMGRHARAKLWANLAQCVGDVFRELCTRFKALGVASDVSRNRHNNKQNNIEEVDDALAAYLGAAIGVLEASFSRKAAEAMLPLWRDASRLAAQGRLGPVFRTRVRSLAPRVLDRYAYHACRRADDCEVADHQLDDGGFEFIDDDEYATHFGNMRAGVAQVAAALVDLDSLAVARAIDSRLRQLLAEAPIGTAENDWLRRLKGLSLVIERVVDAVLAKILAARGISENGLNDDEDGLCLLDDGVLANILEWRPDQSASRVLVCLGLLDAARGVLSARGARVRDALRLLFGYLTYEPKEVAGSPLPCVLDVRRKAAHVLLRVADARPRGVASQFDELRDGASAVLSSRLLCDVGAQYVCEALVLFSSACADPDKQRALLEAVVAGPLNELESAAGAAAVSSPRGLLVSLGVLDASTHSVRYDIRDVRAPYTVADDAAITAVGVSPAETLGRALATLLGVARRASALTPAELISADQPCAPPEPPPRLSELVARDASAAVLARALPPVVSLARSLHALWAPPIRDALRADPAARLALAPSVDELRAKLEPSTASPRHNIASDPDDASPRGVGDYGPPRRGSRGARWAVLLNELRSTVYQIARLWIERRCAFAPDSAPLTVPLLSACCGIVDAAAGDEAGLPGADLVLASSEHRHLASLLKHVLEPLFLRCPPALHKTHLAPVARRIVRHLERRLAISFAAGLATDDALATAANDPDNEAAFYAVSGLCIFPDWDAPTLASVAETSRRELARAYLDVLQVAVGTKGELAAPVALVLKTLEKHRSQALAAGDAPSLALLPTNPETNEGCKPRRDDGEHGACVHAAQERRAAHVSALRRCLLPTRDNSGQKIDSLDDLAAPILRTLWSAIGKWGDIPSCRAATKLAEVCVAETCRDPHYWPYLSSLFESAVEALVAEPTWLANAGCEYDFLGLARAVYVALVIGVDPSAPPRRVPPETPSRHDGPRAFILSALPGVGPDHVAALEHALREPAAPKDHKTAFQSLVLVALDAKDKHIRSLPNRTQRLASLAAFPGAPTPAIDASALRNDQAASNVKDLPGVIISSRQLAAQRKHLFGNSQEPTTHLADLFR